jgi:hypothetical protein
VTYQPVGTKIHAASVQVGTEVIALAMELGHAEVEHWKLPKQIPLQPKGI